MKKNYAHNVIRLKRGKKTKSEQTFWIVVILNKKKTKSSKIVYKLGYFRINKKIVLSLNTYKLAFFLNKGYVMNKSVKNLIKSMLIYK